MLEEVAAEGVQPVSLPRKEVSSTPGPDSMGNQGEGLGGVLDSARRGLRTKEAREDWEERKGKKTTPEGSKFLTFSPSFVNDNNELCERKRKLSSQLSSFVIYDFSFIS